MVSDCKHGTPDTVSCPWCEVERLKAENYVITITEQQITSPSHNDDEYDVAAGGDKC